jgi:hypothetical protein
MLRALPPNPNLDQLKRQAKDLLKALRAGDPQALLRIEQYLPNRSAAAALSDTQLVIAREYGFASWPKLRRHVLDLAARHVLADQDRVVARPESPQKLRIKRIADRITELAGRQAIEQLLPCLWIPAYDIKALRVYLAEIGAYTLLVDALLSAVGDPRPRIRFGVAQAMDHFADSRCAAPLRRMLHDDVPRVRWAALHSLICEECKLAPIAGSDNLVGLVIELALTDPSIRVRRVAAGALGGECYDPRAAAALELLLARETDAALLRGARWALARQQRLAIAGGSSV